MLRRFRFVLLNVKHKLPHSAREISRGIQFLHIDFPLPFLSFFPFSLVFMASRSAIDASKRKFFAHFTRSRYSARPAIIPRTVIIRQRCKPPSPPPSPPTPPHASSLVVRQCFRFSAQFSNHRRTYGPRITAIVAQQCLRTSSSPCARRVLGRGLRVMYILPIRYIHTPADIHRVLYHITYALGAHTIACTGCLGVNTRARSSSPVFR